MYPHGKIRFSIVVPTYNTGTILCQTMDSLLNQEFDGYEIIVVDDGSTDGTQEVLRSYGARIQFIALDHRGAANARNAGLQRATGDYIVNFDHDDILFPFALSLYDDLTRRLAEPPLLIAKQTYFRGNPEPLLINSKAESAACIMFPRFFRKNRAFGITNSCIVAKREDMIRAGGYQDGSYAYDDRALLFMLGMSSPFVLINDPATVGYRMHEGNSSRNLDYLSNAAFSIVARERAGHFPGGSGNAFDRRGLIGSNLLANLYYYFLKSPDQPAKWGKMLRIVVSSREMLLLGVVRALVCRFYRSKFRTFDLREVKGAN